MPLAGQYKVETGQTSIGRIEWVHRVQMYWDTIYVILDYILCTQIPHSCVVLVSTRLLLAGWYTTVPQKERCKSFFNVFCKSNLLCSDAKIYITCSTGCMVWGMCLHASSYCPNLAGTLAVCNSGWGLGDMEGGFGLQLLEVRHIALLTCIIIH